MTNNVDENWIEYRRDGDHERLGWIAPEGERFTVIDVLGVPRETFADWVEAEQYLDKLGLAYLSEPYELCVDDEWIPVRIVNASPSEIQVKSEDYGAIDAPIRTWTLPFPKPSTLRRAK
ncbi:hypothetical protein [Bifidobacterium canis]|nr:hypothetical protein [Bifidobacterium canis]